MPNYLAMGADIMYFDKHPTTGIEWQVDWNSMSGPVELVPEARLRPKQSCKTKLALHCYVPTDYVLSRCSRKPFLQAPTFQT